MSPIHGRRATLGGVAALASTARARAQSTSYPVRPIRVVIPYAAGGGSDSVGRLFYARLAEVLGQPIVIENGKRLGATTPGRLGSVE